MSKIINNNIKSGLMSPTSSPWAAPVLLVKKSNGTWRLVCDYRKLNNVTISDSYPIPEINDLVTELAESKIFQFWTFFQGFNKFHAQSKQNKSWQSPLSSASLLGTGCQWVRKTVLPFSSDWWTKHSEKSQLIIYLDDFLVHSSTETENVRALEETFPILREHNFKLRPDKTILLASKVKFCGFEIEMAKRCLHRQKLKQFKN